MTINIKCECGAEYPLKDEYAGKIIQCNKCSKSINVPTKDPIFSRDKFLLRQKHIAISEKYVVWDEKGTPLLFIQRPAHLFRNLLAFIGGVIAAGLIFIGFMQLTSLAGSKKELLIVLAFVVSFITLVVVGIILYKRRDIYVYKDESKKELLFTVKQVKKVAIIVAPYTMVDNAGNVIARFKKNYIYNILRKRWYCYRPDGSILCVAKEDSIILSLLRRLLGSFFGILRTNFVFLKGETDTVVGEFNRKFTLLDRYILDMTADRKNEVDRRIALALGVLLDTGEKR